MWKKIIIGLIVLAAVGVGGALILVSTFSADLPRMITVNDYHPLLVSEVFDRNGEKVGEFFNEKRMLLSYDQIPEKVVQAFVAAEDNTFFEHHGLNYMAMLRAFVANLRAGRKAQGASTITQQVARTLLLSSEKTYTRKIKEVLLAQKMEDNLTKQEILYLYLNQIFLGEGAYGVGAAAQIYFRKDIHDLTVPEAAILAGLPQAPSRYTPIAHSHAAKERQRYVLHRMAEAGYITQDEAARYAEEPVRLYVWQNFKELAPYYLETIRQMLVKQLGEETVLDKGIKVYTGLDLKKQLHAQDDVQAGLRAVDKQQGYRGALKNFQQANDIADFLLSTRNQLMDEASPERILLADGQFEPRGPLNLTGKDASGKERPNLPPYIPIGKIVGAIVTKVDDEKGLVFVRFAESKGIIDIDSMRWARKPDPNLRAEDAPLKKPSSAVSSGDVILVKVTDRQFHSDRLQKPPATNKKQKVALSDADVSRYADYALAELEQQPQVEGSLLSIDQKTQDVIAMVGGFDFSKSQFNRVLQATRQTGSAFKAIVYASALDKGYTPATPIIDAPVVYEEKEQDEGQDDGDVKIWKPKNDSNRFNGDILFRNALIRSMNVPTVKIIENIGVDWATAYARRLGIFSPLNPDFTLALGSSSVTLYEMTRAFGIIGRLGRRLTPQLVHKVVDAEGKTIAENMTVDQRFETEEKAFNDDFEKKRQEYVAAAEKPAKVPPLYFSDPDQLMKPATAYVTTTLLQGVVDEPHGTGAAARELGRATAAKTGSTSGYYDGWFIGYTPDIVTGVWVGYDEQKSMGRGQLGGRTALPIWLSYMKAAHEGLPARSFAVPDGVVFANIDNETGKLVSAASRSVVRQAFLEGSEPSETNTAADHTNEEKNFFKDDMSD